MRALDIADCINETCPNGFVGVALSKEGFEVG